MKKRKLIKKLRKALRSHVIAHWRSPDDDDWHEGECMECEARWKRKQPERHNPGCLAAKER